MLGLKPCGSPAQSVLEPERLQGQAQELGFRFGLEAAPVLIVFDSAGRLRYAGGYYSHPAAITPLDERIYAQLAARAEVEPLPVFGCAVSRP